MNGDGPQRRSFTGAQGQRLAAACFGAGPPVLLLHGGGQTLTAWTRTARALSELGYLAIAYDQRGHGESEWSPAGAYGFGDFAADLVSVTRQLPEPPALIGASLGGLAGLLAEGELNPGGLTSLTLVDITPTMRPEGVAHILGFMKAHLTDGFGSPEDAAEAIGDYLPHRPRRTATVSLHRYLRLDEDGRYRWHWDPRFIDAVTQDPPSQSAERFTAAARRLRLPVHLIRGASSNLVTEAEARHFLDLVPDARYSDIAGAGHMVVGDRNDIFTSTIANFLIGLRNR